jgi:ubiquinone/menaquinone biosynthesis C-methylase UbiE
MLDIGCGPGRIALALMDYIETPGEYHGFDVMTESLEWATANISEPKPNFSFDWCDVFNKFYNPKGSSIAREYVFPREEDYFDVVFCGSLFTHMLPLDTDQYLSEISRMLKPGGRALATFFLVNDDVEERLAAGTTDFSADHDCEGARVYSKELPEYITTQYESEVMRSLESHGLSLCEDIHYGSWSGAEHSLSSQDVLVMTKGHG